MSVNQAVEGGVKKSIYSFLILTFLLVITSIEGFLHYFRISATVGDKNPIVSAASLFFIASLVILLLFTDRASKKNSLNIYGKGLIFLAFFFPVFMLIVGEWVGIGKLFRDASYFFGFLLLCNIIASLSDRGSIDLAKIALVVFIANAIIFPATAFIFLPADSERFSGMVGSAPIFSNTLLLSYMALRVTASRIPFLFLGFLWVSFLIFISGTRTPFLGLLLFELLFVFIGIKSRIVKFFIPFFAVAMIILLPFVVSMAYDIGGDSRIFSSEETDGGSMSTRGAWYGVIFSEISSDGYIGGYGPGSAEYALGFIPHSDMLRIWYDYSIILALLVFVFFVRVLNPSNRQYYCNTWPKRGMLLFVNLIVFFGMTFHNFMQAPCLVYMMAFYISTISLPKRGLVNG